MDCSRYRISSAPPSPIWRSGAGRHRIWIVGRWLIGRVIAIMKPRAMNRNQSTRR